MEKIELKKVRKGDIITLKDAQIPGMAVYLDCPIHMENVQLDKQTRTFNRIQKWLVENHPARFTYLKRSVKI